MKNPGAVIFVGSILLYQNCAPFAAQDPNRQRSGGTGGAVMISSQFPMTTLKTLTLDRFEGETKKMEFAFNHADRTLFLSISESTVPSEAGTRKDLSSSYAALMDRLSRISLDRKDPEICTTQLLDRVTLQFELTSISFGFTACSPPFTDDREIKPLLLSLGGPT